MANQSRHPDIYERGKKLYDEVLRSVVETPENIGKIISIDPETGDYAIADDLIAAGKAVRERHPGALMYAARIGFDAVYAFGGAKVSRTTR